MTYHKNYFKLGVVALALLLGCFGQIDQALDCSNICNRFEECFDSDFDTDSCTDECRDNAEADQDFADQVDACENCIDQRACSENFTCVDECFSIVP